MDNENVCGAENGSLSPKSPLVDAAALDERDGGMQKYVYGDDAVPERENEELLASLRQSDKAGNVKLDDKFAPPLDPASALLPPLDEQEASAPIKYASEKGGLIDSKRAAEDAPVNMELGLEESRQGEAPFEIEQEPGKKASAEIEHELDVGPFGEVQSIVSGPQETDPEQQYRVQPEPGNTGVSERGAGDNSGPGENNKEPQEPLLNDAPRTSFMKGESQGASDVQQQEAPELVEKDIDAFEVSPEQSEQQIEDYSASKELNEQVDHETANGNVSDEPPAAATVPDEALLMKEPSLSTPAMEALIDADNEEPSLQESFRTVEDPEQHLEAMETHEESAATGSEEQDAFEGILNQVDVKNNEQVRTENNVFGEDDSPKGAPESAKVIVSSGQELGLDTPVDEQDRLANEPPLVIEQVTEKPPINEVPSTESCVERELDIEEPLAVEQEPLEQSLDTAPSSSDLEMAADINEKGDEALPLKADEDTTSTGNVEGEVAATSEVVDVDATTNRLEDINSKNEPQLQAFNGEQAPDNPFNKESDETFNKQLETKGIFAGQNKSFIQINNEAFPSEGETEAESKNDANGQLDEDHPNKRVKDDQVSIIITPCSDTSMEANHLIENCEKSSSQSEPASEREHQGQGIGNTSTITQLESTCDGILNGAPETSVTAEAPNKNHLSEHVLENGDSLRRHPSGENGGEVEGSYVRHSTAPVFELGKVIDGMTEGKATIVASAEKGLVYHGMTAEDDKQSTSEPLIYNNSESEGEYSNVNEVGTQAAEAKGREIDAGEGVGGAKGEPSHMDETSSSDSLALENGYIKHSEGDFEKESESKVYTNGTANMCITDKECVQAFHNERSCEASLPMIVPQQRDRATEHVVQKDTDLTNGKVILARRTNWWGCCGMLDLLLHKDE